MTTRTTFLFALCIASLVGVLAAIAVLGAGVLLTGGRLFGWHVGLSILWPLFLVGMGVTLIMRAMGRDTASPTGDQQVSSFVFWSGTNRRITSPIFKRADFTAVMGGIEVDLRGSTAQLAQMTVRVAPVRPDATVGLGFELARSLAQRQKGSLALRLTESNELEAVLTRPGRPQPSRRKIARLRPRRGALA